MAVCSYCNEDKKLIKAHIIPESFWEIDNSHPIPLKAISNIDGKHPKRIPKGIYDPNILCGNCDSWIGADFDEYAVDKLLRAKPAETGFHDQRPVGKRYTNIDLIRMKRFILSMVWRSDISLSEEYASVILGPWSDIAKQALTDNDLLGRFSICLGEFTESNIGWLNPHMIRFSGIKTLVFYFNKYVAYIKIDQRQFLSPLRECSIKNTGDLIVVLRDFQESKERDVMKSLVRLHPNLFPI